MPYIPKEDRRWPIDDKPMHHPGELNYRVTMLIGSYMKHHGLSYRTINDILGALEGAKTEFYRRVAAPYEDQKRKDNGDVYSD